MTGRRTGGISSTSGQATLELVALLPLLVIVAAAAFGVLSAGGASSTAAAAAEAGAIAMLQDRDPRAAARHALAGRRGSIAVAGSRVTVKVRPSLPIAVLAERLTATAMADAGRGATPASGPEMRGGDGGSADPRRRAPRPPRVASSR